MNSYQDEAPQVLRDFLAYHETIKAHSRKTVDEYFLDLRNFFRYMKQSRNRALQDTPWPQTQTWPPVAAQARTPL